MTTPASQAEIDRLVGWMPIIVAASGVPDWQRKFCASIIRQSRRAGFRASDRQVGCMRYIVKGFQAAHLRQDADDSVAPFPDLSG